MKRKACYFFSFLCIIIFLNACSRPQLLTYQTGSKERGLIFSLKEGREISEERLLLQLEAYPVIFIGDFHLSDKVHDFTAKIIRRLGKKYTLHLANEWFTPADNTLLHEYTKNRISEEEFLKQIEWEKNIGFDFKSFKPIYQALKEANGEMYGINLSKEERKKISLEELDEMNVSEKTFYKGLDLNVTVHKQMLLPFLSYCHAPLKDESEAHCLERMYRVQVAWDEKMGQESALLARSLLKSPKDKLLVFVGALHLESGLGVNMRFARHSTKPFVTILPRTDSTVNLGAADFIYSFVPKAE